MNLWEKLKAGKKEEQEIHHEKENLLADIRKALTEWQIAQKRLDYIVEHDQVDYAIYALEAAEKRYEMLLRHAKKINLSATHHVGTMTEG